MMAMLGKIFYSLLFCRATVAKWWFGVSGDVCYVSEQIASNQRWDIKGWSVKLHRSQKFPAEGRSQLSGGLEPKNYGRRPFRPNLEQKITAEDRSQNYKRKSGITYIKET